MSDYNEDLVEKALLRLLKGEEIEPPKLFKMAGRSIYCEVTNLLEVAIYNSHNICFCSKYDVCAPHYYSNCYYACELCQLITEYCPYYLEKHIMSDPIKLIKAATDIYDIYDRCKKIGKIGGEE